jgi:hypothetical protein
MSAFVGALRKRFFFGKKSSKKTPVFCGLWHPPGNTRQLANVFCFFFSKKKRLLSNNI